MIQIRYKGAFFVSSIPDSSSDSIKFESLAHASKIQKISVMFCRETMYGLEEFETSEGTQLVLPGKYIPSWKKHLFLLQKMCCKRKM